MQTPLKSGTRLDAYEIRGVLGTGGFGVTYEAVEPELERRVAIKEYFPESLASRESNGTTVVADGDYESYTWGLTRFLDEARTLARFKNLHIVHVNRYLEANGTAYLVMDYEDGHPLSAVLKKRRVGERAVRKLMVPILKGLRAVHAQNFLHRDIKPGNIFLRRDGPPLLIDFGAARQALQQRAAAAMTVILTPGYAPLEQYGEGQEQQGPWTDLYALGATLFHCLTGRAPRDAAWRVQAAAHGAPDSIREALCPPTPLCSPEMVELLCWMLRPFAQDRPQSCDQVAAALYEMSRNPARATVGGSNPLTLTDVPTMHAPSIGQTTPPTAASVSSAAAPAPTTGTQTPLPPAQAPAHPPVQPVVAVPPAPQPAATAVSPSDVLAAEQALTDHLGPIAKVLVKKAANSVGSRAEFIGRLADEIDDSHARQEFISSLER